MSSRGALVAALLVVAGIVGYLLLGRGGDGSSGEATPTEEAGARAPTADPRPSGGSRGSDDEGPSGGDDEARHALRGRVEAEGQPVAGAVVTAIAADPEADVEPHTARSGSDGRFELLALPAGRYAISATAPGHLPAVIRSQELRADASITLVLTPGGQPLRGTISDATGGALEGALVRVTPLTGVASLLRLDGFATLSAEDGAYALHVAPGRYRVDVSHPDYAPDHRAVEVGPGAQSQDFALVPMGVVEGVVRREEGGAPVPGAWVAWQREKQMMFERGHRMSVPVGGGAVQADDQGRFTIRGLPPGTILLTARATKAASAAPTVVPLAMAEHVAGVEVLVAEAIDVRGRVVSKQDPAQGIADAEVSLGPGDRSSTRTRTDAEGRFVLQGVLEGRAILGASADGWLPSFPGVSVDVGDATPEITLELERAPAIRGRVEPAAVAEVSIELRAETMRMGMPGPALLRSGGTKTETDAEGRFELGPAQPGPTTVVARASDGRAGEVTVEVGADGADEVVVRLEPRSVVRGSVRSTTGQPVAQATVSLRRVRQAGAADMRLTINGREMGLDMGTTTEDGRFEIGGVAAGDYEVSVTDRYGEPLPVQGAAKQGTAALSVVQGSDVEGYEIVVDAPDGVIRGVVRTSDGEPVPDAWVHVTMLPEPEPELPPPSEDGPSERREMTMIIEDGDGTGSNSRPPVITDENGAFEITGLRQAEYELVAEGAGGGRRVTDVARPGDRVTLTLAELGTIEGVVTLDGQPLRRFAVRAEGPTSRVTQVHDAGGRFEIGRLDAGAYRLVINTPEGSGTAEVTVEPGQTAKRDVAIERFVKVKGRVLDQQGAPVEGLAIVLGEGDAASGSISIEHDGTEEQIVTDAEGRFTVSCAAGPRVLLAIDPERPDPHVVHFFVAQPGQDADLGDLHERDGPMGMRRQREEPGPDSQ